MRLPSTACAAESAAYEINVSGLPGRMTPPLLEHLRYLAGRAETEDRQRAGRLFNNLGYHLHDVADLAGARAAFERALRIFEKFLGPEHAKTQKVRGNLEALEDVKRDP